MNKWFTLIRLSYAWLWSKRLGKWPEITKKQVKESSEVVLQETSSNLNQLSFLERVRVLLYGELWTYLFAYEDLSFIIIVCQLGESYFESLSEVLSRWPLFLYLFDLHFVLPIMFGHFRLKSFKCLEWNKPFFINCSLTLYSTWLLSRWNVKYFCFIC